MWQAFTMKMGGDRLIIILVLQNIICKSLLQGTLFIIWVNEKRVVRGYSSFTLSSRFSSLFFFSELLSSLWDLRKGICSEN